MKSHHRALTSLDTRTRQVDFITPHGCHVNGSTTYSRSQR